MLMNTMGSTDIVLLGQLREHSFEIKIENNNQIRTFLTLINKINPVPNVFVCNLLKDIYYFYNLLNTYDNKNSGMNFFTQLSTFEKLPVIQMNH